MTLTYRGEGLAEGEMRVEDIAPALLGAAALFREASRIVYPDRPPVEITVQAVSVGSFQVHLGLDVATLWGRFVDLFSGDAATALATFTGYVVGLFHLIKKLNGRLVKRGGDGVIETADGEVIAVDPVVLDLYMAVQVRVSVEHVVRPVFRQGITGVTVHTSAGDETVTEDEAPAFVVDKSAFEEGVEEVFESVERLQVVAVSFADGVWRFTDGQRGFPARMLDPRFQAAVAGGDEVFGAGDILRCTVRRVQIQGSDGKLRTTAGIVRVHERGIMDISAVAERLDVKPQSVRAYLARGLMPEPYGHFEQSPVWREADIEEWIATRPGQGNRTPRH